MIEYSIEDLKEYYNKYYEYDINDAANINYIEETLSDIIDDDYTHNNIYHIFPAFVCSFAATLLISGLSMAASAASAA
jgi:hypothetical protein